MISPDLLVSPVEKMIQWLAQWDTYLFLQVNTVWTNPFLDSVFPWWREANTWIPFYLFLIVFALVNFKTQKALLWILFAVLTFAISDQLSSHLIKNWIARPRPCNDEFLMSSVRLLLNSCGTGYSFTSSHATNHFAFALYVITSLSTVIKKWKYILLIWAASIAYAQVYVGVHYPLDVLCGALLGAGIGYLTGHYFSKRIHITELNIGNT
jgi:undecaprenyl-diphosphatase